MFSYIQVCLVAACLTAGSSGAMAFSSPPAPTHRSVSVAGPADPLLTFGAAVVAAMVFCRTQQYLVPWFAVGTFAFGLMSAGYVFTIGAWPLGLAVGGYAVACLYKWITSRRRPVKQPRARIRQPVKLQPWEESRMSRMFGPMA